MATSLERFLKGGQVLVRQYTVYEERQLRSKYQTVGTARKFIGKDGYNLFLNNCEHFCNLCTFNKKYSKQINRWTDKFFDSVFPF